MVLRDSREKIDWAKAHIDGIETRIELLHKTDTAIIQIDPKSGGEVLKHDFADTRAFTDIALMLGDVLHNLKCALDYSWFATVERIAPTAVSKFAKFPVRKTREELENALRGREIHIANINLFNLVVGEIKPYKGGNPAVWPLHNFDIRDKHHLLIPVLSSAHIDGIKVEEENGELWYGNANTAEFQKPPYYVPYEKGLHVKDKGKLRADVVVEDRESDYPLYLPESLVHYSDFVLRIVESFERFLKKNGIA